MIPPCHTKHTTEKLVQDGARPLRERAPEPSIPPRAGLQGDGHPHTAMRVDTGPPLFFLKKSNWQNASRTFKVVTVLKRNVISDPIILLLIIHIKKITLKNKTTHRFRHKYIHCPTE